MKYRYHLFAIAAATALLPFSLAETVESGNTVAVAAGQEAGQKQHPHEARFRTRTYKAVEPVKDLAKRLKMGNYDIYEHPTGIYFPAGADISVRLEGNPTVPVQLYVADFSGKKPFVAYDLKPGDNKLSITEKGLGYIHYESPDYQSLPEIKVTIKGGLVNGVFTDQDDNDTWKQLLDHAASPYIDLYGKNVHLVLPVDQLKQFCSGDGSELLALYDRVISIEQGIVGYGYKGERPLNHMFGRVVSRGYMFADGIGTGFNEKTMKHVASMESLMNPAHITFGFWGIAHEFGHVNQVRPGFKWLGMTEVTNNMMAMACCYEVNKKILRLEREAVNDGTRKLPGGYYNKFTKSALIDGEKWQMQAGGKSTGHSHVSGGDVFVKLIPLWQLYLYTHVAGQGNKDFYPEFHKWLRENDIDKETDGRHQLNFMKMACQINNQDLSDYFEAIGMLKPIDVEMKDYRTGKLTITEEECKEVKQFAAQFPKPSTPLIQYINANNIDCYKAEKPLQGPDKPGDGIEFREDGACAVSHDIWKNAVAFETWSGDKLVHIALSGIGAPAYGDPVTVVSFPEGATEIKAVGWNGKKKTVYLKK